MLPLARLPLARLVRTPRGWLPVVGWAALAVASAIITRTSGLANGADHVLRGTFGLVILPLLAYGIVSATLGGEGLRTSVRGLAALGASPPRVALALVGTAMATSAIVLGLLAAIVCVIAHGSSDPPLGWDVVASFGVAFVGGAAYAAYFCAGSSIGRGAMRGAFLALDYLLGVPAGFGSLFTPRAHVMSLLGGATSFELSRRSSSVVLVVLMLVYLGIAVGLTRRPR
jgi:hypothetical protein